MIAADQLQRFSRECLLLRKSLEETECLAEIDYRILRSHMHMLIAELERKRVAQAVETDRRLESLGSK